MVELRLQRSEHLLDVQLGAYHTTVPLSEVAMNETTWECIFDDAAAYGRALFEKTFRDEQMRALLTALPVQERLTLIVEDPIVAAIPWEYLRDTNGKLIAGRCTFVRSLPTEQCRADFPLVAPFEIVAVPVSPIDETRMLNTGREWGNLVKSVATTCGAKDLIVKRVRPPTCKEMTRALSRQGTTILHFMGHSGSTGNKAALAFEDARAYTHLVDAADFADAMNGSVFLVIMTSCLSAVGTTTTFGNIAHALVHRHIPYALGMQCVLPDDAALELSEAFYDALLRGQSVEEAVMQTRRALEEPGNLFKPHWLAGIPVLYTSLRTPAPPVMLSSGKPTLVPDPLQLEQSCDVTALPLTQHFIGRGKEMREVLDALLSPNAHGYVLLRGLGGIGKTALARAIAERVSWHYQDRVLAYSFETFARLGEENQPAIINEQFADTFYNRLAGFYDLDTSDNKRYPTPVALQKAIIQRRKYVRSLLVLDNIETLIDAQKHHPAAQTLAAFLRQLEEGDGAVLCTSRMDLPVDWGQYITVPIYGLADDAGADLFLALLPTNRQVAAAQADRLALSRRVQGHPLSIRLLAARFAETTGNLASFLHHIEEELLVAEQITPTSLEDPERQKTLYACMAYSIKRLSAEQAVTLNAISIFNAPFLAEFAARVTADEQTAQHLQTLARLSLLETSLKKFEEGELLLLELHPMVRWYLQYHMPSPDPSLQERYGEVYVQLADQAFKDYDRDSRLRYLLRQSLLDCENALLSLPPAGKSMLAYYLATPYQRLGQNQRALKLYEQSLEIYQELGDIRSVAVTQHAMADVLSQQGKPQEAMQLYAQSLRTKQELGDLRGVAVTQSAMADVLRQQGKPQEAMQLYEQVLKVYQELGDIRSVAVTQSAMADVLRQQGKPQEAMQLYEQALRTSQELGDPREVAVTQANYGQLLFQCGENARALIMIWQAYTSLEQHGFVHDAGIMRQLLLSIKAQVSGSEQFDNLWEQVMSEPMPAWLLKGVVPSSQEGQDHLTQKQLEVIVANTVAVLTNVPEKRDEWRSTLAEVLQQAEQSNRLQDAEFFATLLALLEGQTPSLPDDHFYSPELARIQTGIANNGLQDVSEERPSHAVPAEVMQAIQDYVSAENWEVTRRIVEAQQELLFQPVVETIFEQNIEEAKKAGEERAVHLLELHLALLRGCKTTGIEAAFEKLVEKQDDDSPFDDELIPRSIKALLSGPQEKMAHVQYLMSLAGETADGDFKLLLTIIQLALFSPNTDLSHIGRELKGAYKDAWGAIVLGVESGGVDPRIFAAIATNTLAVLGPAAVQRGEWRSKLVDIRNQATVGGNRHMTPLLDAVIGLLDADGNPAGLGEGLQGSYARVWQTIVEHLP